MKPVSNSYVGFGVAAAGVVLFSAVAFESKWSADVQRNAAQRIDRSTAVASLNHARQEGLAQPFGRRTGPVVRMFSGSLSHAGVPRRLLFGWRGTPGVPGQLLARIADAKSALQRAQSTIRSAQSGNNTSLAPVSTEVQHAIDRLDSAGAVVSSTALVSP